MFCCEPSKKHHFSFPISNFVMNLRVMKKFLLIVFLLTALGLAGFSQSGIYSGGMSGIAKHDQRKTGLLVRPEIGCAYAGGGFVNNGLFVHGNANAGYQITPRIYLGGGLGCFVGLEGYYNSYLGIYGYRDKVIPLYASFRWYWFDGLSSPFLELNVGGERTFSQYCPTWDEGVYYFFSPAIGYDIKNYDIKFSVLAFPGIGFCLTFGYNFLINEIE